MWKTLTKGEIIFCHNFGGGVEPVTLPLKHGPVCENSDNAKES